MSSAERYIPQYSVDDYRLWQGDWELLEGIPVAMTPSPFGPHQRVAHNLAFALEAAVRKSKCSAVVLHETDWVMAVDTVVRPDVVLLCGGVPEKHIETTPELIVEVLSPSTVERDLGVKHRLYRQAGVHFYLLADPERKTIYFADAPDGNLSESASSGCLEVQVCGTCQLDVDLAGIFEN